MEWKPPHLTDHEFLELTPDVTQMMYTVFNAETKDGEIVPGEVLSEPGMDDKNFIVSFDEDGMVRDEETFDDNYHHVNKYNKKGRKIKEVAYRLGKLWNTKKYEITDDDLLIEIATYNAKGVLDFKSEITYTDTGQSLEHISYKNKGGEMKLVAKTVHFYSDEIVYKNNIPVHKSRSTIDYKGDGSIDHSYHLNYNDKGLCIEEILEYPDPKKMQQGRRVTTKYNEHGDSIETNIYNYDGTLRKTYIQTHEYDKDGKRILPTKPNGVVEEKDPFESETFETDSRGNWIKKIIFYNKVPTKIIIRELAYDGEEKNFVHPLSKMHELRAAEEKEEEEKELKGKERGKYIFDSPDIKWQVDKANGIPEHFPVLRFYAHRFRAYPSVKAFCGPHIDALALREKLKKIAAAEEIHSYNAIWDGRNLRYNSYTLLFPMYWGYILHTSSIGLFNKDKYYIPPGLRNDKEIYVFEGQYNLLRPSKSSGHRDAWFEKLLSTLINECILIKKTDIPLINTIEVESGHYVLKEYKVNDNFKIKNLDVNYGEGFENFHNQLMKRFKTTTKGLVLFHGIPGTGKTYYIRHLLRKMTINKKRVIYIPPNMVDHLVDPRFLTFISAHLKQWAKKGHSCVLLIEDAEPLLAKRKEGVRNQGVTNLLNMTDGLLNDILNIQIICTFNVEVNKLDSALLRPGRLIARKEFKALPVLDANLLAQRLGIKHHFTKPATLGEIYGMQINQHTLIHEVDTDNTSSATIEDFL